jgi:hypothetical protein
MYSTVSNMIMIDQNSAMYSGFTRRQDFDVLLSLRYGAFQHTQYAELMHNTTTFSNVQEQSAIFSNNQSVHEYAFMASCSSYLWHHDRRHEQSQQGPTIA